jgi:outer membrane protein TolC
MPNSLSNHLHGVILSAAKDLPLFPRFKFVKSKSFSALRMTMAGLIGETSVLVLTLATLAALPAAQAQNARKLTLREAAQLTLANSRAIQLASIRVERAAAEHAQAKSIFRPQVLLGSGLAYSKGFPLSIEGSAPSIFQVNASQALFDASLRNIERQASAMRDAAAKNADEQRDAALLEVVHVYLDLDRNQRSLVMLRAQSNSLEATAELIAERVNAGLDTALEGSKARLAAAKVRANLKTLEGAVSLLTFRLRDLAGIAQDEPIETLFPELTLRTDLNAVGELAEQSLRRSPAIAALDDEVRSREFAVRSEQASRWPRIHLVGQYALFSRHNNYEDYFQRFERNNVTIGASIVVPLYERERLSARMSKAEADLKDAKLRRENTRAGIGQQVRAITATIGQNQEAREVARLELDVVRKSLDQVLTLYEEGKVNRIAVEQARAEENRAWVALFDAEYQTERAKLELLKLTGELQAAIL